MWKRNELHRFVDGMVLSADNEISINKILQDLKESSKQHGMNTSIKKMSGIVIVTNETSVNIKIKTRKREQVYNFMFCGNIREYMECN